jgi:predicted enzyme related to lactoylglutathione lyase
MRLENVVWDASRPRTLGSFWAEALGARVLGTPASEDDGLEARLDLGADAFLDLCFPPHATPSGAPARLHLDLRGGPEQDAVVERLERLGARRVDIGQGDVPWVVLADPEGNAFCVMEDRPAYRRGTGPVAALPLDVADPDREARFWSALTGWRPTADDPYALRHPAGVGPLLELLPEPSPRTAKAALHLDVRPDADDVAPLDLVRDLGGTVLEQPGPGLPWTVCADPSGNEVCLLGVAPPA